MDLQAANVTQCGPVRFALDSVYKVVCVMLTMHAVAVHCYIALVHLSRGLPMLTAADPDLLGIALEIEHCVLLKMEA